MNWMLEAHSSNQERVVKQAIEDLKKIKEKAAKKQCGSCPLNELNLEESIAKIIEELDGSCWPE
jgi:altronate dehydratase